MSTILGPKAELGRNDSAKRSGVSNPVPITGDGAVITDKEDGFRKEVVLE